MRKVASVAHLAVATIATALGLLLADALLDGFTLSSDRQSLALAVVVGVLNALLAPLIVRLALPLTVLTLGLGALVLNGLIVYFAAEIYGHGVEVDSIWTGVLIAICVTVVNALVTALLGIDDDDFYYRNVVRRQARRAGYVSEDGDDAPGILFLEIDGLAHDVLRLAIRAGTTPTMGGWLRQGTHNLFRWECDWSSQTGAMQAGILLGSNWDLPAFRWWDKDIGRAVVCNHPADAREIERQHSNGSGLLHHGGASRANLLSGDAPYSLLTTSTVLTRRGGRIGRDYFGYFANPYSVTRTLILGLWELVKEYRQQRTQRRRDVRPRIRRDHFRYPLTRSFTNVLLRELEVAATIQDLYAGRPVIYTMFLGYDEVAHHSGLERAETLRELELIDRQFKRIERAAAEAPRRYEIVVLSDHGQTQGSTFLQRYGLTLDELVKQLTSAGDVEAAGQGEEGSGYVRAAATEIGMPSDLDRSRGQLADRPDEKLPEVAVFASGCLGLISFPREPGRVTLERIDELHPTLVPALRSHPGIAFLLVRSNRGAVALGPNGANYLDEELVEGDDPLAQFGPTAATHVKRTDTFPHCADLVVNSTYWAETGEVAAFEELVGSHGGLGGTQQHPFVLHPVTLPPPEQPVVGAESLHLVFRGWLAGLGHESYAAPFEPARTPPPAGTAAVPSTG
jgi:uncharacterized membrane protein YvlD (DUF360 family)